MDAVNLDGLLFQPTLPVRGVTVMGDGAKTAKEFQPTLPVRGVTLKLTASRPAK